MSEAAGSVDPAEIAKFEKIAAEWWDPNGPFRPLHLMDPVRLDYLTTQIAAEFDRDLDAPLPFAGLRILDVGCGGGLLSEPFARLGAEVTGIDAGGANLDAARAHAEGQGLEIAYRHISAEALAQEQPGFDVVLAMEIVEHVSDPAAFLQATASLLRPGGLIAVSTLNRTAKSFGAAIIGAEYLLRWLPKGTHDWQKFAEPDALATMIETAGCAVIDRIGFRYAPLSGLWSLSADDFSVNYALLARRNAA